MPSWRRPWISIGSVARPVDAACVIPGELSGTALLQELSTRGREELLVLDAQGLVYGVLLLADVDAALRSART